MKFPKVVDLTVMEGQTLLVKAFIQLPAKLGSETFSDDQRTTANDQQVALRACLRKVSPLCKFESRSLFGPEEAWEKSADGNSYKMKEAWENKTIPVEFSEDAYYGAFWTIFIPMHPDCPEIQKVLSTGVPIKLPQRFTMAELDEVIYPLTRKLHIDAQIRRMLRIDVRRGMKIQFDGEPAHDEDNGNGNGAAKEAERENAEK